MSKGKRTSAIAAAIFLVLACTEAFGEVTCYRGELEVLQTSGGRCGQSGKLTLKVELVLKEGGEEGAVSGFARATPGSVGRFTGAALDRLALTYPYFNNPIAEGHVLSLVRKGDAVTGELRGKPLDASVQDCSVDRGRLQLKKIAEGPEAEKALHTLSFAYDALLAGSEGTSYLVAGRTADAERSFVRGLEMWEQAEGKDGPEVAASLANLAKLCVTSGQYADAEPLYKRALEIRESKLGPDYLDTAATLNSLGSLYVTMGRYPDAEPLLKRAVQIFEAKLGKDHPYLAESMGNLAWLYEGVGRYAESEALYKRALEINQAKYGKDHPYVTASMNNLAELYTTTGRYAEAEAFLKRALTIWESAYGKDHSELAAVLDNLAWLYRTTGRYSEAEAAYKRAIQITESKLGKDHPDLSPTMNNLAELYITTGRYTEAEALLRRSIAIWESKLGKDHPDLAASVDNLAWLYVAAHRYSEAEALFKRAVEISEAKFGKNHPDVVPSLSNLAQLLITAGRFDEAEALLKRALPIAQTNMVLESVWNIQAEYSLLLTRLGHRESAIFFGKQAVNTLQGLRRNVANIGRETLQIYQKTFDHVYKSLSDLLIEDGRLAEAQQVIDLLKQEEYFDFVQRDARDSDVLAGRATLTGREAPLEAGYREQAGSLAKLSLERGALLDVAKRTPDQEARLVQLDKDLESAGVAFQKVLDDIDRELTEKRQDKAEQIKEAQGLQEDLRELGEGTVALYTLMGEDKYRLLLIAPDFRSAYEVPVPAKELNRKVQAFRLALKNPEADPRPLAKELYTILLEPARADLEGLHARTLMWSLDGALRYVPVNALHDGKQYLVENYRNVIFTPASQARLKDRPKSGWKVLGMGVSGEHQGFLPLPGVKEELADIVRGADGSRGVLPGIVDLDEAFTLMAMKDGLRQRYPVVHIASHFQFTPGDDTKSYLLLGDGSFLTLNEVKNQNALFGGVDLLTLSACNTGVGDGKEVEGFGVLAQRQGAKGVIATLWPVADESTGRLMRDFYRLHEQEKLTKAEALQKVQQSFITGGRQSGGETTSRGLRVPVQDAGQQTDAPRFTPDANAPYSHPYYWAPFILIGNWL